MYSSARTKNKQEGELQFRRFPEEKREEYHLKKKNLLRFFWF